MREEMFLVASKGRDGEWNKLCKAFESWFFTAEEAEAYLKKIDKDMQRYYAVFRLIINIEKVEKLVDGKNLQQ